MARSSVYSTRFLQLSIENSVADYVVPAGKVAVIRCMSIYYFGGPTAAVGFVSLPGAGVIITALHNVQGGDYVVNNGHWVCEAGDTIQISSSSGNAAQFSVSGYLLDLP